MSSCLFVRTLDALDPIQKLHTTDELLLENIEYEPPMLRRFEKDIVIKAPLCGFGVYEMKIGPLGSVELRTFLQRAR